MKIIQLSAENVKRLIAVEIKPDGNMVQITGKNGQGKTSVLDSIWWALSGAKHIQAAPIRRGATSAKIKLDMGEIVVTRTFKREKEGEGFTTKLEVVGAVKGTPQGMLDSLLDSLAFDPLAFARMDGRAQVEVLKKYVTGFDFGKNAAENSIDFSARTEKNRKAKELRIQVDQIMITDKTPTERIDEAVLVQKLADAGKHNADVQLRATNRQQMTIDISTKRSRASELRSEAEALIKQAEVIEAEAQGMADRLAAAPPLPELVHVIGIQDEIAAARAINEQVAKRERKSKLEQEAITIESEAKQLTSRMEAREQLKLKAISEAKLPIEGITFSDDTILLGGVPMNQASDAEQLRVSCALAMAGNPALRVIRVRDGSLLDEESLALLAKMADERDYQVWIERVEPGKVGFVIEDGQVKHVG